jgi:PIN domain nuclease of toxin-antitoxin system
MTYSPNVPENEPEKKPSMVETYVLDSYAILALLGEETGSDKVATILRQAQKEIALALITWVNVGEVAYIVERRWGTGQVSRVLGNLEATKISIVPVERDLALVAAHIKAEHSLSYADAFAAALAIREKAVLVTGDPEFRALEPLLTIEWIR